MTQRPWSSRQLRLYPELHHAKPNDPQVRRWVDDERSRIHAFWVVGIGFLCLWPFVVFPVLFMMGWGLLADIPILYNGIPIAAFCAWPMGILIPLVRTFRGAPRSARRKLRAILRRRGIPICLKCGYEGGDITAPKCPECGAAQG